MGIPTYDQGLSSAEAARRLAIDGPNDLPGGRPTSIITTLIRVLAEPMFLLLLAAIGIYFVLGEHGDAAILATSLLAVVVITVLQERRTEHALAALRDLSSPHAMVLRDGTPVRIAGRDIARGDIVLLSEGDRVPADGILRSAIGLTIDEAILTGESLPVAKTADLRSSVMAPVSDAGTACAFSGTLVLSGHGSAEILATGSRSEFGRIGAALDALRPQSTPLFVEIRLMVRRLAILGVVLCAVSAIVYGISHGSWLDGALVGITLAMSLLPEEFPVVLTVFLAIGAWRISKHGVLTRSMPAVETIGAATVLAVDKTGTLTENRMRVVYLETPGARIDLRSAASTLSDNLRQVLAVAYAASETQPSDPMERAIHEAATTHAAGDIARLKAMQLAREYDLTPQLLAVTHVWKMASDPIARIAIKGAPETILDLCRVDPAQRAHMLERAATLAEDGFRVLGVAHGTTQQALPSTPQGFELHFLGFIGLADPIRASVPAAIAECARAGIRVMMITGDHAGTARAIATQIGLPIGARLCTGAQLQDYNDEQLREVVRTTNVYARISPQQKLRLVQALKADGEIVAMTGDGVNDAPALKAAHIGVAMGSRGTDVAREAAALVLLHDDFASLVTTVRLGRRIYSNIRNAMTYLLAVHIPLAGMGLLPLLFGWPLFLTPVHVVFMEFMIDPACALVFEAESDGDDVMSQAPRNPKQRLFSRSLMVNAFIAGTISLIVTLGAYAIALSTLSEYQARALGFVALVTSNLLIILVSRMSGGSVARTISRPNAPFWWIGGLALVSLGIAVFVPAAAHLFRFAAPPVTAVAIVLIAVTPSVLLLAPFLFRVAQRVVQNDRII